MCEFPSEDIPIPDENGVPSISAGQLEITQRVGRVARWIRCAAERPKNIVARSSDSVLRSYLRSPYFSNQIWIWKIFFPLALASTEGSESTILPFGQETPPMDCSTRNLETMTPNIGEWRHADTERIEEQSIVTHSTGFSTDRPLGLRVLFNSNTSIKQVAIAIRSML